jgi:transcriptional regulator with XRE-family HTH domain
MIITIQKGAHIMETKIMEIAQRIRGLREILELSVEHMAKKTGVTVEQYRRYESGAEDFGFTFLYQCAGAFGVDIVELLTGEPPRLSFYSVVRNGEGLPMRRLDSFTYQHIAYRMQNKLAEPFVVTAPYHEEEQTKPIEQTSHSGQEFDYILEGTLKVQLDNHSEVLNPGDAIFYDSRHAHGMIAVGGKPCVFLAFVMKDPNSKEED